MAKRKHPDYGVEQPLTIERPGEYDWHVWKRDRRGEKPDEWMGFFKDSQDALDWCKTRSELMVINNIPPSTSTKYARRDGKYGYPWDKDYVPQRERPTDELLDGYTPPKRKRKTAAKKQTKEQQELREEATSLAAKHENDEAQDIADGTTQSV